jgi:hypothetical protein
MGCRNKRAFRLLSVAEETETMQGKIQGWLELDERDPGFQLLVFL